MYMEPVKLDSTLVREIKNLVGDGSKAAKFEMLAKIDAANRELAGSAARTNFYAVLKKHGRAVVAVAVACTLRNRWERLDCWGINWALAVLDLLPFVWTQGNMDRATIKDYELHPTAICDYAGDFIKLTTAI